MEVWKDSLEASVFVKAPNAVEALLHGSQAVELLADEKGDASAAPVVKSAHQLRLRNEKELASLHVTHQRLVAAVDLSEMDVGVVYA